MHPALTQLSKNWNRGQPYLSHLCPFLKRKLDPRPLIECKISSLICGPDLALRFLYYHVCGCPDSQNAFVCFARSDPIISSSSDD